MQKTTAVKSTPIKSEEQYEESLSRIYKLMQQPLTEGSAEFDKLEQLSGSVKE